MDFRKPSIKYECKCMECLIEVLLTWSAKRSTLSMCHVVNAQVHSLVWSLQHPLVPICPSETKPTFSCTTHWKPYTLVKKWPGTIECYVEPNYLQSSGSVMQRTISNSEWIPTPKDRHIFQGVSAHILGGQIPNHNGTWWHRFDGQQSFPYGQITPNSVTLPCISEQETLRSNFKIESPSSTGIPVLRVLLGQYPCQAQIRSM